MGDTYIEHMVKRVTPVYLVVLKGLLYLVGVSLALIGLLVANPFIAMIAVAALFGIYFLVRRWDVEYEYIYQNGELDIDKIMSKASRKRVCTMDLSSMEIMYKGTDHPDARNFNNLKIRKYTTRANKDKVYTIVITGASNYKVEFEPNEEMIEAIKLIAPRKVKQN